MAAVSEQSLLDDMRSAVRGDFERARRRRDIDPAPEPSVREVRAPLLEPPEPEPASAQPEQEHALPPGRLARLLRR